MKAVACAECRVFVAELNAGHKDVCYYCHHDIMRHSDGSECTCPREMILPFALRCAVENAVAVHDATAEIMESDPYGVDRVVGRNALVYQKIFRIQSGRDTKRSRVREALPDK